ncbi:MAG: enoyl-CoA hydratase/isomerase family protein [Candidatus Hodarchaeota archaeon]
MGSETESERVLLEIKGKVGTVILNDPDNLNVLRVETFKRIIKIFEELEENKKVKCVVIKSVGDRAFSAGLDTKMLTSGDMEIREKIVDVGSALSRVMFYYPKPIICCIAARCVGWGFILAMLSDFRYSTRDIYFKLPELEIGIYPATGALTLPMLHFGPSRGKAILLLSEKLFAEDAERIGFVNGLANTREEVEAMVKEKAKYLSRLNAQVFMYSKLNTSLIAPVNYEKALKIEEECFDTLVKTGGSTDNYTLDLEEFKRLKKKYLS